VKGIRPVTCSEAIWLLIARRGGELPPGVTGHLARCEFCQQLVRAYEDGREKAPAPAVLDRIKSVVLANLRPVTPLPSSRTLLGALFLLSLAVLDAGTLWLGTRGWQALALAKKVSVFAPLLAGAYLLGLAVVRQMVPGDAPTTRPVAWSAAAYALLVTVVAAVFGRQREPLFVPNGLSCFGPGVIYAASAALFVWLVIRRGAMLSGPLMGAMTGGLAGFIALAGIEIRCPNPNGNHILVWHLPLVLAGALGGVAVGEAGRRLARRLHPRHPRSRAI
jgi:hypothetical protein